MKFLLSALVGALVATGTFAAATTTTDAGAKKAPLRVPLDDISATSDLGMKLLGKARQLEDGWNSNYQYDEDFNEDEMFLNTWVAGYSIKFQGCHHISQWNDEADDEEDVRVYTKRLVRFRLCPTAYCNSGNTQGCSNGYGDYIIDMYSFLEAYMESAQNQDYYEVQYYTDENGNQVQAQNNGNSDAKQEMLENYLECAEAGFRRRRRELDETDNYYNNNYQGQQYNNNYQGQQYNNNYQGQQEQYNYDIEYYMGPYCASQGGAIYLGVFTDDTCTTFADANGGRDTYLANTGQYLPYGQENIVNMKCLTCSEDAYENDGNNGYQNYNYYQNDQQDADDVLEMCENLYDRAGKCEANLPYGTAYEQNNNACNYMEGIKIVRKDGSINLASKKANRSAGVVISFLTIGFACLCGYVYFLKSKLERASINLNAAAEDGL